MNVESRLSELIGLPQAAAHRALAQRQVATISASMSHTIG